MNESDAHVTVARETTVWERAQVYGSTLEGERTYPAAVAYHVERGWEKIIYRPTSQKRRIPSWAAEAIWIAYALRVPADKVKS